MIKTTHLTKKTASFSTKESEFNSPNYDAVVQIWRPHLPNVSVPIYVHFGSKTIKKYIPLRNFSKDFKEMYEANFFKKVFYDDDLVTAQSIHNTFFIPKISADF